MKGCCYKVSYRKKNKLWTLRFENINLTQAEHLQKNIQNPLNIWSATVSKYIEEQADKILTLTKLIKIYKVNIASFIDIN
jgi:hypothetical protein